VFRISAMHKQGTRELSYAIMEYIEKIREKSKDEREKGANY
jgi:predicted GTPase